MDICHHCRKSLSKLLHHPAHDQSVRLKAVQRSLEEVDTGNWLMVLDHVFPETMRGSLLFTRDVGVALASAGAERHEVPILDVQEGVKLFLGDSEDGELDLPSLEAEEMAKAVGCVPLAWHCVHEEIQKFGEGHAQSNQTINVGIHA